MPANLVASILQMITPEVAGRIALQLGIDKATAEKALAGGVPAILAALLGALQKPGGREILTEQVSQHRAGARVGTDFAQGAMESGAAALSSLFGGSTLAALSGALQRYAGMSGGDASSILAYLAPLVLGGLGQMASASGKSPGEFLVSQRDTIVRALPNELADKLAAGGLIPAESPIAASRRTEPTAPESILPSWLVPFLVALAALGIAWYFLTPQVTAPRPEAITAPAPTAAAPSLDSIRGIRVGEADVGTDSANAIGALTTTLNGIEGEPSAVAAVPEFKAQAESLGRVATLVGQLSPENRRLLASAVRGVRPTIDRLIDQALALPQVGPILTPAIDPIRAELDRLTRA